MEHTYRPNKTLNEKTQELQAKLNANSNKKFVKGLARKLVIPMTSIALFSALTIPACNYLKDYNKKTISQSLKNNPKIEKPSLKYAFEKQNQFYTNN